MVLIDRDEFAPAIDRCAGMRDSEADHLTDGERLLCIDVQESVLIVELADEVTGRGTEETVSPKLPRHR